ncbi:MAG: aldo/keto reductase [Deltaproteobacteria bacterium]|nr:aldo/keto reductase [Deltaproteobacteria bacterium]MBI3386592.1 aldo/keto reductase [Deltaproteobacteria bacterium]
MDLRTLGRTNLTVSRLGVGLAALGRPGYANLGHGADLAYDYDVNAMAARTHAVLDAAWDAGVRYFDTARSYGRGEEFLATWLSTRRIAPAAVTVGSKWGYTYTAEWRVEAAQHEVKDHSLGVLRRQIGESRALLGAQLDLYQIHSATLDSGVLDNHAVLDELARLRAEGVAIGLTLSGPRQADTLRRAMAIRIGGAPLFDCVQATWNLLEGSAAPALRAAHAAGLGVIIKEPLANGRLTDRNIDASFAAQRRALERVASRLHTTLDALALAAVLAQPWVDVVLSGAATVPHLQSNVTALTVAWDEATADSLMAVGETPEHYWATRSRFPWN